MYANSLITKSLGIHYREHRILRNSFWIKLAFIIIEVILAICFGVFQTSGHEHRNTAAVLEWVVALVYAFYVASFYLDFLPARSRNSEGNSMTEEEKMMRETEAANGNGQYGGSLPYQNHSTSKFTISSSKIWLLLI